MERHGDKSSCSDLRKNCGEHAPLRISMDGSSSKEDTAENLTRDLEEEEGEFRMMVLEVCGAWLVDELPTVSADSVDSKMVSSDLGGTAG